MARNRPSPIALVQAYFDDGGAGAESTELLSRIGSSNQSKELSPEQSSISAEYAAPKKEKPISNGLILDRQTAVPSNSSTVTQSNPQTVIQQHSQTVEQLHSQTESRSVGQTVEQSDRLTATRSDSETVKQSGGKTVDRITGYTMSNSTPQTVSYQTVHTVPLDVLTLPYNQAVILEYLISAAGITSARTISEATHIGIPSVRDAISRLVRRGFMHNPVTVKNAAFQGFSYVLNPVMVGHFQAIGGLEQNNYRTVSQSHSPTVNLSDSLTPYSSSKEQTKLTTTNQDTVSPSQAATDIRSNVKQSDITPSNSPLSDISSAEFILTGPTGIYWEGEGLQESQVRKWCEQFEVEPAQMKQQLEWARFDLVNNEKQTEVRKDIVSWFFGCLRQTGGCYPRPVNYRSPAEIRAEQMEEAARNMAECRTRQAAAERELAFQQILANPASDEYKMLINQVGEFAREVGGPALEAALREVFILSTERSGK